MYGYMVDHPDGGNKVHRSHCDSLAAALAVQPTGQNRDKFNETQESNARYRGWYGPEANGNTAEGARDLYRRGWASGAAKIAAIETKATLPPTSVRRRRVWSDQGDEVDIHRVNSGRLDIAWQTTRRQQRVATRAVTIVIPFALMANQSIEDQYPRGAAALRLADVLSEAGYSVGIVGSLALQDVDARHTKDCAHTIDIKAPDQPMDMANLACVLAHPGFFRTVGFAMICSVPSAVDCGLGHADHGERVNSMVLDEYRARGDRVIGIDYKVQSTAAADEWLAARIAEFNQDP